MKFEGDEDLESLKEDIVEVLKTAGRPLKKDEIIQRVEELRKKRKIN